VAEPGSPMKRGIATQVALAHIRSARQQQFHRPAVTLHVCGVN
jgi:hypothetical protein